MSPRRTLVSTIAVFAAIGFAVLALLYWAFIANPPLTPEGIDWAVRLLVIAAIVSFSIFILTAPESIGAAAGRRSNRLTANAIVAALVAIGIAILLNFITENVPTVRADWTAGQSLTLTDQSIKVLQDINNSKRQINVYGFYSTQTDAQTRQQMGDLLKEYTAHTNHVHTQLVDTDQSPTTAFRYLAANAVLPAVVFEEGTRQETAKEVSEQAFTSALVRLGQTGARNVVFLTGHGERDPNDTSAQGYSPVKDILEKDGYTTVTRNLSVSPTLTLSDATVLVIAEPIRPLNAQDTSTVTKYLDSGGRVLLLLDPAMPKTALQPFVDILAKYGVTPVQGMIIDLQNSLSQQDPRYIGAQSYPSQSEITQPLARQLTAFALAMGLKPPTSTVSGFQTTSILQSSVGEQLSWLETDLTPENQNNAGLQIKYDAGKDIPGPVTYGLTIEPVSASPTETQTQSTGPKTRLVVFGDADFPSQGIVSQFVADSDLFANSVSWLAGSNELVSIRKKADDVQRTIVLDAGQQRVLLFSTMIGFPVLVILVGGFVWWRRR